jgi:rSAM/selenodomain-associated transferase 2
MLSIVIPTYNEVANIETTIKHIAANAGNDNYEIIIADGGSHDKTVELAQSLGCTVVNSNKGRGNQLNAGAEAAQGQTLLFLHADTLLPVNFINLIDNALDKGNGWGRFDVTLSGKHFLFRVIEKMMSLRSRLTGIATGDQAIFIDKTLFNTISGFKNIPLMEDIELTRQLKKLSRPACLPDRVITSSRRWEENGIVKTVLLMWMLRFLYFIGISPFVLQKLY